MRDTESEDAITFHWRVHFQLETGDWEWLTTEAKHPAGAKQNITDQLDCDVVKWESPTLTDAERSLTRFNTDQPSEELTTEFLAFLQALADDEA